jgi:hypothetical protein
MDKRSNSTRSGVINTKIIILIILFLVICGITMLSTWTKTIIVNSWGMIETLSGLKTGTVNSFGPEETSSPTTYRQITWKELIKFIDSDHTNWKKYDPDQYICLNFAIDLVKNARKMNLNAWVVLVSFYNEFIGHAFTGFVTTDRGIVFIEPQTDIPYVKPTIGNQLCDAWTGINCMEKVETIEYRLCDNIYLCTPYEP